MAPQKHHYIPEFYLKKWCDPSGNLIEYCRRQVGPKAIAVVPRPTSPGGTGYEFGLYSLPGAAPEVVNAVEEKFMRNTDGKAAVLRDVLLTGQDFEWDGQHRSAWSRFIMSLLQRNPEKVKCLTEHATDWQVSLDQHRRDELARRGRGTPSDIGDFDLNGVSRLALTASSIVMIAVSNAITWETPVPLEFSGKLNSTRSLASVGQTRTSNWLFSCFVLTLRVRVSLANALTVYELHRPPRNVSSSFCHALIRKRSPYSTLREIWRHDTH